MTSSLGSWNVEYGSGLISKNSNAYTSYVAVTSSTAWRFVEPHLSNPPIGKEFVKSLEEDYLLSMAAHLPSAQRVLAIGGGVALDAGKYVAWKKKIPLVMIPTITSTGSVYQPLMAPRLRGKLGRVIFTGPPERVLYDIDIIRQAPSHLNSAGMAECICYLSSISSLRWWNEHQGDGAVWDQSRVDEALNWIRDRVTGYSSNLDSNGVPGLEAIRICAEVNRERLNLKLPSSRGIDHYIDPPFSAIHGRGLLHGEAVALGTVLSCFLYGWLAEEAVSYYRSCGTRYKPLDIGCKWDEIYKVLKYIPGYLDEQTLVQETRNRPLKNYLHLHPIDEETFKRIVKFVESS